MRPSALLLLLSLGACALAPRPPGAFRPAETAAKPFEPWDDEPTADAPVRPPAPRPRPPAPRDDRLPLAVMPFEDDAGLEKAELDTLDAMFREAVNQELSDRFMVMTDKAFEDQLTKRSRTECVVGSCLLKLGEALGVPRIIGGTVRKVGGVLRLAVESANTETDEAIGSKVLSGRNVTALMAAIKSGARPMLREWFGLAARGTASPDDDGTLRIESSGADFGVSVDGQPLGYTPVDHKLDAGAHEVAIRDRCHQDETVPVNVSPGKAMSLKLSPRPREAVLRVYADGDRVDLGATILVDDVVWGTTPATLTIPLCSKELVVRAPDGTERRRRLSLKEKVRQDVRERFFVPVAPAPAATAPAATAPAATTPTSFTAGTAPAPVPPPAPPPPPPPTTIAWFEWRPQKLRWTSLAFPGMSFDEAEALCRGLGARLPTKAELLTLHAARATSPALDRKLAGPPGPTWSDTRATIGGVLWTVDLATGGEQVRGNGNLFQARCVR
jgi:hypothetical protein